VCVRKWETDGMSDEQVDAIFNRLQPRLLDALTQLIIDKLLVAVDVRFRDIQGRLAELRQRLGLHSSLDHPLFDAGDPEATIHAMATETDQRAVQEGGPLKAATRQTASPG